MYCCSGVGFLNVLLTLQTDKRAAGRDGRQRSGTALGLAVDQRLAVKSKLYSPRHRSPNICNGGSRPVRCPVPPSSPHAAGHGLVAGPLQIFALPAAATRGTASRRDLEGASMMGSRDTVSWILAGPKPSRVCFYNISLGAYRSVTLVHDVRL